MRRAVKKGHVLFLLFSNRKRKRRCTDSFLSLSAVHAGRGPHGSGLPFAQQRMDRSKWSVRAAPRCMQARAPHALSFSHELQSTNNRSTARDPLAEACDVYLGCASPHTHFASLVCLSCWRLFFCAKVR